MQDQSANACRQRFDMGPACGAQLAAELLLVVHGAPGVAKRPGGQKNTAAMQSRGETGDCPDRQSACDRVTGPPWAVAGKSSDASTSGGDRLFRARARIGTAP